MNNDIVELLLVEDNPNDLDLALHALKKNNLANKIQVVRDGQEALDFLYGKGNYSREKTTWEGQYQSFWNNFRQNPASWKSFETGRRRAFYHVPMGAHMKRNSQASFYRGNFA